MRTPPGTCRDEEPPAEAYSGVPLIDKGYTTMKIPMSAFTNSIEALLRCDARSATIYLSPEQRVTATHVHRPDKRSRSVTISVTFGKLNWAGREFVKACKRAGEPFPVRKVQLKFWPKKRR